MDEQSRGRMTKEQLVARAMKDEEFRKEFIENPREVVIRECGLDIPENVKLTVLEESSENYYLVLPPFGRSFPEALSDEDLDRVAGGMRVCSAFGFGRTYD